MLQGEKGFRAIATSLDTRRLHVRVENGMINEGWQQRIVYFVFQLRQAAKSVIVPASEEWCGEGRPIKILRIAQIAV